MFWNKKSVINQFTELKPQNYWERFFKKIPNRKHKRVLDLGCGGGRYTEILARLRFRVYAIDNSSGMVRSTKFRTKNYQNVEVIRKGDMKKLVFNNGVFDLILANGVFHNSKNVPELRKSFSEAARVLKKGGVLCLNMFFDGGTTSNVSRINGPVFKTKDALPMVLLKKKDLLSEIKQAGFLKKGRVLTYTRKMDVGARNVFRGVFVKI